MIPVTAIFDIGKTNKKFFLFDKDLKEVYRVYHRLEYIEDEDGDPTEPLAELVQWVKKTFAYALTLPDFAIEKLNFTTYGATLVHLDKHGNPATPLFNYIKDFPGPLLEKFYQQYGGRETFCQKTSSPTLGMLNSGLQLYWLKYEKTEVFKNISHSLHLPQFISYLFTGKLVSDYTSIGCHTGLWDFTNNDYHVWLKQEGILPLLPEVTDTSKTFPIQFGERTITVGIGVHDSSAALLPYLETNDEPFALLSTGTWAITINPFNSSPLTMQELERDCLHFIGINGKPIKISRLFIGEEHKFQIDKLYDHFSLETGYYKKLKFDKTLYQKAKSHPDKRFKFEYLKPANYGIAEAGETDLDAFENFEAAYYCFLHDLTDLQVNSTRLVLSGSPVPKIFIDGGFNANEIFVEMLKEKLAPIAIETTDFALGTALGAAILVK